MNITSEDEALLELFENGKTSDKKYKRLPIASRKKAIGQTYLYSTVKSAFMPSVSSASSSHRWRYAPAHP